MFNKKAGFTLAEVLITLGIIGVVAAMTIPTLIANYQKTQYVSQLKKVYTTFNQALSQMAVDEGCPNDLKCTSAFDVGTTNDTFGDKIINYMKIVKNCKTTSDTSCWSTQISDKYDGSSSRNDWGTGLYRVISADGTAYDIINYANNCGNSNWSNNKTNNMTQVCGLTYVDVNGPAKGPNNRGRDIFGFWITNGKGALLYPLGGMDDKNGGVDNWWQSTLDCMPEGGKWATRCTGRIMEEGWEMNY